MIAFASSNLDVRYSFVPLATYVSHSITPRFTDRDISFSLVTKPHHRAEQRDLPSSARRFINRCGKSALSFDAKIRTRAIRARVKCDKTPGSRCHFERASSVLDQGRFGSWYPWIITVTLVGSPVAVSHFASRVRGTADNHIDANECITSRSVVSAARGDIPVEGLLRERETERGIGEKAGDAAVERTSTWKVGISTFKCVAFPSGVPRS